MAGIASTCQKIFELTNWSKIFDVEGSRDVLKIDQNVTLKFRSDEILALCAIWTCYMYK